VENHSVTSWLEETGKAVASNSRGPGPTIQCIEPAQEERLLPLLGAIGCVAYANHWIPLVRSQALEWEMASLGHGSNLKGRL
jgi:hypothetical protein